MSDRSAGRAGRVLCIAALAMAGWETSRGASRAQMTAGEFDALPDADRRAVLVGALEERGRAVRNLRAPSVTRLSNVEYRDGKAGRPLEEVSRYVCELRRKDGNHWASVDWFLPEDRADLPTAAVVTAMDSRSGVSRSVARHRQMKGVYGAITTAEDEMIRTGRFHYWFDARFDKPREFPLAFLLEHRDAIRFEGPGGDGPGVRISLRVESKGGTPFEDVRTVWVDPARGFLPVRMHRRWEYKATGPDDSPLWSVSDTEVDRMEQVGGVWFPTHFTQTATSKKSIAEGYAGVYETTVGRIELGTVTDGDLEVRFEKGAEVNDRIKGVWFVADEATQTTPTIPGPPRVDRRWLIAINLTAFLAMAAAFALRARRGKLVDALGR